MDKRDGAPNRRHTEEFKIEVVRLAQSIGINQAANRLGMPRSSVGNWVRRRSGHSDGAMARPEGKSSLAQLEAENARLRRELANVKVDLEIVKKAAAYFAKESR